MDEVDAQLGLDREKIKKSVRLQLPIEITTYTLPRNMEIYIRNVLEIFLSECRQEHMYEYLNFCLGELLTNAKKANTKRVYFKEKNLDLNDPVDYEKGMENFKDDTLTNINHYLELQKKAGLYIKLVLHNKGSQLKIEISNNSKLTTFEKERIKSKLASIGKYNSMEEVFTNVLDQSEGAGLGIILIVLMLSKIGLSKENFTIVDENDITVTRIVLPCNKKVFAGNEILTYEFVTMQDTVPVLENSMDQVTQILNQENVNRCQLNKLIDNDPTLMLQLLKNTLKVDNSKLIVKDILEMLSDEELRQIYSSNNESIVVVPQTEERKLMWNHSQKVSFYAFNLLKNISPKYDDLSISAEEFYTIGLVNSTGYILLNCANNDQTKYVEELSGKFDEAEKIVDIFYSGNCAPYISMIFAKKIGMKDIYASIIGSWNNPEQVAERFLIYVKVLYLAEMMQYYDEKTVSFYQLNKKVLDEFCIHTENEFRYILNRFKQNF